MSDQAERLRQLVGAGRRAASGHRRASAGHRRTGGRSIGEPRARRTLACSSRAARGRRDVEPRSEPGDRAGRNGPARAGVSTPTSVWRISIFWAASRRATTWVTCCRAGASSADAVVTGPWRNPGGAGSAREPGPA